ncbi:MAG: AmmeMemoRadiSam system protein A [Candidatus Gracilibacteria bacterium]|jgi:AmmeMemoRadiSam system protein A
MNNRVKKYLLEVARIAICERLGVNFKVSEKNDDPILKEKRGVFVTLTLDGKLRGCIGNITPVYTLVDAVKNNAVSAGFEDPRFDPLSVDEIDKIKIEISALSIPKKLEYKNPDDLLEILRPNIDGVIIEKGWYKATYLPQVWEELKDEEMFLGSLCEKAGMNFDEWEKGLCEVSTYQVEAFGE